MYSRQTVTARESGRFLRAVSPPLLGLGLVEHGLRENARNAFHVDHRVVDGTPLLARQDLARVLERALDAVLLIGLQEVTELAKDAVVPRDHSLELVLQLAQLLALRVGRLVRGGLLDDLLDLGLRQASRRVDLQPLRLTGREVLRRYVHDSRGVDRERDLDLGDAFRRRRNADELELAEGLVLLGDVALALQDVDLDGRLVVRDRRENLRVLRRDRRVAFDELDEDAPVRLEAERKRGDVQKNEVLDVPSQDASLDRGADGHDLVRVDRAVRRLPEDRLHHLLDLRRARLTADEDDGIDPVSYTHLTLPTKRIV